MKSSLTNYGSKSHFIFFELESLQFGFIHIISLDKKFSFRKPSFSSLYLSPILFFPLPETNFYTQRLCLRILQSGKGRTKIHKEFFFLKVWNYEDYYFFFKVQLVCLFFCPTDKNFSMQYIYIHMKIIFSICIYLGPVSFFFFLALIFLRYTFRHGCSG